MKDQNNDSKQSRTLNARSALEHRRKLKLARAAALDDAEGFLGIVQAIESLGKFLNPTGSNLGQYESHFDGIVPEDEHATFGKLYNQVRIGRNDALHSGAFARALTKHSVELGIILEDALSKIIGDTVGAYMSSNPVVAEPWWTILMVRREMLANSFSYLPIRDASSKYYWASDFKVAQYLRSGKSQEETLENAKGYFGPRATPISELEPRDRAVGRFGPKNPALLVRHKGHKSVIVGIVTPFDLL